MLLLFLAFSYSYLQCTVNQEIMNVNVEMSCLVNKLNIFKWKIHNVQFIFPSPCIGIHFQHFHVISHLLLSYTFFFLELSVLHCIFSLLSYHSFIYLSLSLPLRLSVPLSLPSLPFPILLHVHEGIKYFRRSFTQWQFFVIPSNSSMVLPQVPSIKLHVWH